jgi:hypothetical protein
MLPSGVPQVRANVLRFAAVLGILAAARSAAGQVGVWSTRGPAGGSVHCVVPDPSHPATLYAGTDQGVFKSDDGGASWRAASAGMPAARVQTIAIDPAVTATLYAGTLTPDGVASVGIFKSTDGAASWTAINAGLIDPITEIAPLDVDALAVDPRHPGTVLAGARFSEIFKSSDAGATWQPKTLGGFNVALETSAFQFDPSGSSKVYAASTSGLLQSTDGGETWALFGNASVSFYALASDPSSGATLYAGNVSGFGILKSTDGGAHWSSANDGLPVNRNGTASYSPLVLALAVDPSHPSTVYAGTYGNGLFQSSDGGSTWASADAGMRDAYVAALALSPGQSSTVYAATLGGGVYRSLDSARTWTLASAGLNLSLVSALVADPAAPDTLYAATFDGVEKSADGGVSWQGVNTGLPVDPVAALALVPGSHQTLFAATRGGGLLQSADGGVTWSASSQGLTDSFVSSIAVDPSNPSTLYAGTAHPYDGTQSERVFKSTDGGSTWAQTSLDASSFSIDFLAVNPGNPSQVVAGSQGSVGYFQSLDSGKTWSKVASNASCGGVNAILFSGSTTYLGTTAGVCRSTDGGKTWLPSAVASLASVSALLIDPADSSTLYAGASPVVVGGTGGVFRSSDGGQTWEAVGTGLSDASVTALAIDAGRRLHAGISGGGVAELAVAQQRQPVRPPSSSGRRVTRRVTPR